MDVNVNIKQETLIKLAQIGNQQRGMEQTKENAVKISNGEFWAQNIEGAVNFLEAAREIFGANVSYDFNGHTLYSKDVTLDSAYEIITGHPKAEFEALRDAENKKYEEERDRAIKAVDSESLIQRGLLVVEKGEEEAWTQFVRKNEGGMGIHLVKNALEVMEAFTDGKSLSEAHKIFDSEGHSGFSANWTLAQIEGFGDKSNLFLQEYIQMERNGDFYRLSIDEITKIEESISQKAKETIDVEVKDEPKVEEEDVITKLEKTAKQVDINDLIQRGLQVVEPGMEKEWEKHVRANEGKVFIHLVKNALDVMEALDSGKSLSEAHEIFESEGHSSTSAMITLGKLEKFGDKSNLFLQEFISLQDSGAFYRLSTDEITKIEEQIHQREKATTSIKEVENNEPKIDSDELIQRGLFVVAEGMEEAWEGFVRKNENGMGIQLVKNALEVMEAFADGKSMEEAHEIFDSMGHSGFSAKWTLENIKHFCDKENKEILEYVEKENEGAFYKKTDFGFGD